MLARIRDAIAAIPVENWDGSIESVISPQPINPKQQQRLELERRLLAGEDRSVIAASMGITSQHVGLIAAMLGLPKPQPQKIPKSSPPPKFPKLPRLPSPTMLRLRRQAIETKLQAGQRICDIARELGGTYYSVKGIANRMRRSMGGSTTDQPAHKKDSA